MIQFSRTLARQLRAVIRIALGVTTRGPGPTVSFQAGPSGLLIRAKTPQVAVEYCRLGSETPARFCMPYVALANCQGRSPDPITIQQQAGSDGQVALTWIDHAVPQHFACDPADPTALDDFPQAPAQWATNRPGILAALHDASQSAAPEAGRYAIDTLQLQGAGRIVATDGRQLLRQGGFKFPWTDDLLVCAKPIFGCPELPQTESVTIGKTEDWISICVGAWTLHFAIRKEARFPLSNDLIPARTSAAASLRLSVADAKFLTETLPRLPVHDEQYRPVTLDLQERIVFRARPADSNQTTDLVLSNSKRHGEPMRINIDRRYVARALKLGFRDIYIKDPRSAMFVGDASRDYLWMVLEPEFALSQSADAIQIHSPVVRTATKSPPRNRPGTTQSDMATHTQIRTLHALADCQQVDLVELLQDGFHVDQPGELSANQARRLIGRMKAPARKEVVHP